ncbi:MAG: hypothetical protein MR210_01060 [Erysipelotrichaceae bacterium]|nr:hypothetical protein [Erysipelotrichaceae bacterium]MDY5252286.1 hypothetical protein [Erysipelotrichaceae bacterium]
MFNKLKNLIFEEEDIIEDDEDTLEDSYESAPVVKTSKPKVTKKVEKPIIEDNYYEEAKPVSKPVKQAPVAEPTETYVPKSKPVVKQQIDNVKLDNLRTYSAPSETPAAKPAAQPVAQPKSSLGIQVDDVETFKPSNTSAQKATMAAQRTARPKSTTTTITKNTRNIAKVETNSTYERRPVISPIFGLSEKDVQSSMNSTLVPRNGTKEVEKDDIISPIYGNAIRTSYQTETKESYDQPVKEVEANDYSQLIKNKETVKEEPEIDNVPLFSLDDILASRDEQDQKFSKKDVRENQTRVVNNRNYSLFDDED